MVATQYSNSYESLGPSFSLAPSLRILSTMTPVSMTILGPASEVDPLCLAGFRNTAVTNDPSLVPHTPGTAVSVFVPRRFISLRPRF